MEETKQRIAKNVKCIRQVFDSIKCALYYPGDVEAELDLDSDAALCFQLDPEDRKYAMETAEKRRAARIKEQEEMKEGGFHTLREFRVYKQQVAESGEVETVVKEQPAVKEAPKIVAKKAPARKKKPFQRRPVQVKVEPKVETEPEGNKTATG